MVSFENVSNWATKTDTPKWQEILNDIFAITSCRLLSQSHEKSFFALALVENCRRALKSLFSWSQIQRYKYFCFCRPWCFSGCRPLFKRLLNTFVERSMVVKFRFVVTILIVFIVLETLFSRHWFRQSFYSLGSLLESLRHMLPKIISRRSI